MCIPGAVTTRIRRYVSYDIHSVFLRTWFGFYQVQSTIIALQPPGQPQSRMGVQRIITVSGFTSNSMGSAVSLSSRPFRKNNEIKRKNREKKGTLSNLMACAIQLFSTHSADEHLH